MTLHDWIQITQLVRTSGPLIERIDLVPDAGGCLRVTVERRNIVGTPYVKRSVRLVSLADLHAMHYPVDMVAVEIDRARGEVV